MTEQPIWPPSNIHGSGSEGESAAAPAPQIESSDVQQSAKPEPALQTPVTNEETVLEEENPRKAQKSDDSSRIELVHTPSLPGASVTIGTAGMVVEELKGDVSISAETRKLDILDGATVSRQEIMADPTFHQAAEWRSAWEEAVEGLQHHRILIVVAPRGFGSTTFSLRILGSTTQSDITLFRLEADWGAPKVNRLPLGRKYAYQLDLQDPERDQFHGTFLHGLGEHASRLNELGSYLVLAVAEELWEGREGHVPDGVIAIRLEEAPDAQQVVERHLEARGLGVLTPYAQTLEARRHIAGRDAVAAVRAVDIIGRHWREFQKRSIEEHGIAYSYVHVNSETDSGGPVSELDVELKQAIEGGLGDWQADFDLLFNDRALNNVSDRGPLSYEDRCLFLAVTLRHEATAAKIEADGRALEAILAKKTSKSEEEDLRTLFSGRGLRSRLKDLGASVDGRDRVALRKPGYGEAALVYVWENYERMRGSLIAWMVGNADPGATINDPVASPLAKLILRLQAFDRLVTVRDAALSQSRPDVIIEVMGRVLQDEHMGRRARGLLYEWAGRSAEIQRLVVRICGELLKHSDRVALVRLGRVADKTSDAQILSAVLQMFQEFVAHQDRVTKFAQMVADWQSKAPALPAAKLGLLALMGVESDGIPWLLSSDGRRVDLERALRALGADLGAIPEAIPTLASWVERCAADDQYYAEARRILASALRTRTGFQAGVTLMGALVKVRRPDGRSVGEDLYVEMVDPELRSKIPLEGRQHDH